MGSLSPWLLAVVAIASVIAQSPTAEDALKAALDGKSVHEFRGYYKREHSVVRPYTGAGVDIPNWSLGGHAMVSSQQIRLTANEQSRMGALWNTQPVWSRDWELQVSFKVAGGSGDLFGDGMAIWYAQEPAVLGPVFGSKDYFKGLGIFLDTYSNHNGPHTHGHPFISAMVSDGSLHYDHDRDGTHTQLGGEHTGCEAKFRNKDVETQVLIRYVADTLSIFADVEGKGEWKACMSVDNVQLPTGYFFGFSAATGELSDAHDVISVKMFEQDVDRVERKDEVDRRNVVPHADFTASPRDHVDDPRPSKLGWLGTIVLVIVAAVVIVGGLGFGFVFLKNRNERQRKRFY